MAIRQDVSNLIAAEQRRQNGNFIPNDSNYLEKIAAHAESVVHEERGLARGFVFFYCNESEKKYSYITLIMVDPSSRNLGIGRALVNYVVSLSAIRGFDYCRLEVRKENIAAIKIYESMGFLIVEDRGEKYLMNNTVR